MRDLAFVDRAPSAVGRGVLARAAKCWLTWAMFSATGAAGNEPQGARKAGAFCQSTPPVLMQRRASLTNRTAGNSTASEEVDWTNATRADRALVQLQEAIQSAVRWNRWTPGPIGRGWVAMLFTRSSWTNSSLVDEVRRIHASSYFVSSPAVFLILLAALGIVLSVCLAVYFRSEQRFGPSQKPDPAPSEVLQRVKSSRSGPPPSLLTSPVGSPTYRKASSSDTTIPRTRWLCPSLVVPSGMELVFAVSELVSAEKQQLAFHIVDLQGQPLSRVVVDEFGSRCGIFLHSLDERPLAWVRTAPLYEKRGGLPQICWPSGEAYGTIAKEDPVPNKRYVLRDASGQRLFTFNGNFQEKAINVVNANGRLVCDTERCAAPTGNAPYFQVRVAPGVDAGLILCGLLAIDKLRRT